MFHSLTPEQIHNLLSSQVVGRLAFSDGSQPYIIPVTYFYDGTYIYGQTNSGSKLNMLRKNPAVCFEVDSVLDMNHWQSAIVTGEFEELTGEEIIEARKVLFNRVFQLMTNSLVHSFEHAPGADIDDSNRVKEVVYRIKIGSITGRLLSLSKP